MEYSQKFGTVSCVLISKCIFRSKSGNSWISYVKSKQFNNFTILTLNFGQAFFFIETLHTHFYVQVDSYFQFNYSRKVFWILLWLNWMVNGRYQDGQIWILNEWSLYQFFVETKVQVVFTLIHDLKNKT